MPSFPPIDSDTALDSDTQKEERAAQKPPSLEQVLLWAGCYGLPEQSQ